jgi:hypothetical protein
MVVTRQGFSGVVNNAFAGLGFPVEAPTILEFPLDMFLVGADLTPINENIDKVVAGLTTWESKIKETGMVPPPTIRVEGKDYDEALVNMNQLFLKNMLSDGLPLLPPTEARVSWILTGTELPRDMIIAKPGPKGGVATVETLAVCLAMAGGRPEYMPVLVGIMEAMLKDDWRGMDEWNSTTSSTLPACIVNGPIGKQIRLNSSYGWAGPNPLYPAGGSIGRALRFLLMFPGGGIAGIGSMANHGGGRYTNLVFAEDEDNSPWEPLSVSEFGYPQGTNIVAHFSCMGFTNEQGMPKYNVHQLAQSAAMMGTPYHGLSLSGNAWESNPPGALVVGCLYAQAMNDYGMSKLDVKNFLWERAQIPVDVYARARAVWPDEVMPPADIAAMLEKNPNLPSDGPWPITGKPENMWIIVAGGEQSQHAYWLPGKTTYKATCAEIKLPANWDALLKQAEEDLGPPPA